MTDWKVFKGNVEPHDELKDLPAPPPWRFSRHTDKPTDLVRPATLDVQAEAKIAKPFLPSSEMVLAVNAALYLRRPLLITGKAGTGKSTLIAKVAYELKLGPVVRWPINSRATVRSGVYEYDAVGRLQSGDQKAPVEQYLTLGPLGTALVAASWPRPLLIDEIDKSDLDFANDLLNVIEDGYYEIPELRRLGESTVTVKDWLGSEVSITDGRLLCSQFPFVVMTSNAEREFPAPFLRRCVRLNLEPPTKTRLGEIVASQLKNYSKSIDQTEVDALINEFDRKRTANEDVSTDQLLNAVFLAVALRAKGRTFGDGEAKVVRENLMKQLTGPQA